VTYKFVYDSDAHRVRPVPDPAQVSGRPRRTRVTPGSRWFILAFAVVLSIVGFSVARAVALSRTTPAFHTSSR